MWNMTSWSWAETNYFKSIFWIERWTWRHHVLLEMPVYFYWTTLHHAPQHSFIHTRKHLKYRIPCLACSSHRRPSDETFQKLQTTKMRILWVTILNVRYETWGRLTYNWSAFFDMIFVRVGFFCVFVYLLHETAEDSLPNLLTYSMEQSPSWEANWFAASQDIPRVL
jgi:hypothetical protein